MLSCSLAKGIDSRYHLSQPLALSNYLLDALDIQPEISKHPLQSNLIYCQLKSEGINSIALVAAARKVGVKNCFKRKAIF